MADNGNESKSEPEQIRLMKQMVELSVERTELSKKRSKMSEERSEMSDTRTQMSAQRTYLNVERTLSVWIRTALAVMVFGIAIDRFGLARAATPPASHLSSLAGAALVAFGTLMSLVTGARFLAWVHRYRHYHDVPFRHGPYLAPLFALLAAVFGAVLLLLMLVLYP